MQARLYTQGAQPGDVQEIGVVTFAEGASAADIVRCTRRQTLYVAEIPAETPAAGVATTLPGDRTIEDVEQPKRGRRAGA